MPPPPPPPAALMEELIEEILLRFPPHDPALLVHAALVCKQWCRLVSGAGFRRRFRDFHRTPPMLGFLYSGPIYSRRCMEAKFVRTAASCPPISYRSYRSRSVLDARHGRVLLLDGPENALVIWDLITDDQRELHFPKRLQSLLSWSAAVLCAAHGSCDHLDCHGRSFLVVFACTDTICEPTIGTYSSDDATWRWSDTIYTHQQPSVLSLMQPFVPRALVGNALYFGFYRGKKMILKYELESHEKSAIDLPHIHRDCGDLTIITVDGGLGFATLHESKLYIWSRKDGLGVDGGWTQTRVIDLDLEMLFHSKTLPDVVGVADEISVIFLTTRTDNALFTFDLKTYKVKKICEGRKCCSVFPYMSFYTPALGAACRGKGPGGSSA